MSRETQSEMFIRTLSDLLKEQRAVKVARQRDLHRNDAEKFMQAFGRPATDSARFPRLTVWRGPIAQPALGQHPD